MSADDQGGAGRREVAYRLFADEFEDADFSYSESDEERAPNYVVTPTGARVNRLFVVGVLTEVEDASEDVLRARVVDPTGAVVVYAGQYQPDAQAFFDRADTPAFVAVTGKARTFQPDDSDVIYTSVRPENVNEVDAATRDRWTVQAARQTLDRVGTMADALRSDERGDDLRRELEAAGVDAGLAAGIPLAIDHYGTTPAYLDAVRELALSAGETVAGEREEVDRLDVAPDAIGDVDVAALAGLDVTVSVGGATEDVPTDLPGDESSGASSEEPSGESDSGSTVAEPATESAAETIATSSGDSTDETADTGEAGDLGETGDLGESDDLEEGDDLDDFEPGEFDLDDEEREEIESEFGTEFKSGTEVESPGEADIETPSPVQGSESPDEEPEAAESTTPIASQTDTEAAGTETASGAVEEASVGGDPGGEEVDADVDVDEAVMDAMEAHDDGDGATETEIVGAVTDRIGADPEAVREGIQDVLMQGKCYEPEDDVYKTI